MIPHPEPAGNALLCRRVNLFRGSVNPKPVKVLTLTEVLDAIQDGTYQRPVQRLRALLHAGDRDTGQRKEVAHG